MILIVAICVAYPTTILYKLRTIEDLNKNTSHDLIKKYDTYSFWLFFAGLYVDPRQNY
jgi:hypothetical protein